MKYCFDFPAGSTQTIYMPAPSGECYHFDQWMDGSTDNPRTVVVLSDTTYTAAFSRNELQVQVDVNDAAYGSVSGGGMYECGEYVTISAEAAEHYHFVYWEQDGLLVSYDERYVFEVSGNHNDIIHLTAYFEIDSVRVEVGLTDGSVGGVRQENAMYNVVGDNPKNYPWGVEQVMLTAVATDGCYVFDSWSDGSKENPYVLQKVESDVVLNAKFVPRVDTITIDFNESGSIRELSVLSAGTHVLFLNNDIAIVTKSCDGNDLGLHVVADGCYNLRGWDIDGDGNAETVGTDLSINVVGNQKIGLIADKKTYHVQVVSEDATKGDGYATGNVHDMLVECGDYIVLEHDATSCYEFDYWLLGSETTAFRPTSGQTFGPITQDTILTCYFKLKEFADIRFEADNTLQGHVTADYAGGTYIDVLPSLHCGDTFTLTAEAKSGYEFESWIDGVMDSVRTVVVAEGMVTIYIAVFKRADYHVVVDCDAEKGNVAGGGTYSYGDVAHLSAIAADGYQFVGWSDGYSDEEYDLIVLSDSTLTALFEEIPYTIYVLYDEVLCVGEDYTLPSGRVVTYNGGTEQYVDSTDFEYEAGKWCKRVFTITLYEPQRLPEIEVIVLPEVEEGEVLNFSEATDSILAELGRMIDRFELQVVDYYWEINSNGGWIKYQNVRIANVDTVIVRFVLEGKCERKVSDEYEIKVQHKLPFSDDDCVSVVYLDISNKSEFAIDTARMYHLGYRFEDADITWYKVGDELNNLGDKDNDVEVGVGVNLPLSKLGMKSGEYYAQVQLSDKTEIMVCSNVIESSRVRYSAQDLDELILLPSEVGSGEIVSLIGLDEKENAKIRVFTATGQTIYDHEITGQTYYDYAATLPSGLYMLRVETEERKKTLKFRVR